LPEEQRGLPRPSEGTTGDVLGQLEYPRLRTQCPQTCRLICRCIPALQLEGSFKCCRHVGYVRRSGQGLSRHCTDVEWVDTGSTARPVRLANSTPDVKALFKNAGYVLAEAEETEDRTARYSGVSYRPPSDYWPQPVAVSGPYCSETSWTDGRSILQGRPGLINAPRDEETLKRGSDSLLEAKLKEYAKPRLQAMQLRAKSLDMTQLARINEGVVDAVEPEVEYEVEYEEIDETEIGEPQESPNGVNGTHVPGRASYPQVAGTRMSAPAGHSRPHAVRIASGLSDDLIRRMQIR